MREREANRCCATGSAEVKGIWYARGSTCTHCKQGGPSAARDDVGYYIVVSVD